MSPAVLSLAAAGFAVITTEFVIVGILPLIARDLGITIPQAGLFVTLFAFTVALFGPPLTAMTARVERRFLFVAIMGVFAAANLVAALAPNVGVLALARVLPALALPVFWSVATSTVAQIAGPERAGRAISLVFNGIALATVLGIPIGTLIADAAGWRVAFGAIAVLCAAAALVLALVFPRTEPAAVPSLMAQASILRRPAILGHLALSGLIFTGMFTAYSYLADLLERLGGYSGQATGLLLMGFGAVGLIGNAVAGRLVDRDPLAITLAAAGLLALAMAAVASALALGTLLPLGVTLLVWGTAQAASFLVNQVRVMKAAPAEAQAFAASLNVSVCNLGIGLGAAVGGAVIDHAHLELVGWTGAAITLLATLGGGVVLMRRAFRPRPEPALVSKPSCC